MFVKSPLRPQDRGHLQGPQGHAAGFATSAEAPPQRQGPLAARGADHLGYPAIFALALNTARPALLYHRLFSYQADDFISQPWEWMAGMRNFRALAARRPVCLVADAEADDQKLRQAAAENRLQLIARSTKERIIEVWAPFRLPDHSWTGWAVVAQTYPQQDRPQDFWLPPLHLVLITQRPVRNLRHAWGVYRDWSQRGRIEPFYRFIQEDGLDVETILLRRLESFRRMLLIVLLGAFFIFQLAGAWSPVLIQWIRSLASAVVGTTMDRQGHYLLLRGVQRLLSADSLLEEVRIRPPPAKYLPAQR